MRWTEFNMQLELGYKHKIKISTDFSPYFTALLPEFQESDFVGEQKPHLHHSTMHMISDFMNFNVLL